MTTQDGTTPRGVLVSDFDGTMTRHDFYRLAIEHLIPRDTPNYWAEYRAGTLTHFEALQRYFKTIRHSEKEVLAVVDRMELDSKLPESVKALQRIGWSVVVTSAGCSWYVSRLLAAAGVKLEVYSNPGRFEEGRGLLMEMPTSSPYLSATLGVDKARVVRRCLDGAQAVAFAGDGFPDLEAARLVPGKLRFAKSDLADVLGREGLEYQPFDRWSEVADAILQKLEA